MRLCAVSVDLDEVDLYHVIHGLNKPPPEQAPVHDLAVDRYLLLARELHIPLTFFVVGCNLERPSAAERLARAAADGHELACHTFSHPYDLVRLAPERIRSEVVDGRKRIEEVSGSRVGGFRAPGYAISDALLDLLEREGFSYDSSVFPSPYYYLSKFAVLAVMHAWGKPSGSMLDGPASLLAPTRPYRTGRPFHRPGRGLLELPLQVTPRLRLPVIGTSLLLGGSRVASWLVGELRGEPFVNLELHGVDLLDAADGLAELARYQPDLRTPVGRKRATLTAFLKGLQSAGFRFVTLGTAAAEFNAALP